MISTCFFNSFGFTIILHWNNFVLIWNPFSHNVKRTVENFLIWFFLLKKSIDHLSRNRIFTNSLQSMVPNRLLLFYQQWNRELWIFHLAIIKLWIIRMIVLGMLTLHRMTNSPLYIMHTLFIAKYKWRKLWKKNTKIVY